MEENKLFNWLKIAFQQPIDNNLECFYFDKKLNAFFSITLLETILIDEKFKINYTISPYYTIKELKKIRNWIKKIKHKDESIILIPSYGIFQEEGELIDTINSFLFKNAIRLSNSIFFEVFQKEMVQKEQLISQSKVKKSWWKFW
jgi:hypothetical protein